MARGEKVPVAITIPFQSLLGLAVGAYELVPTEFDTSRTYCPGEDMEVTLSRDGDKIIATPVAPWVAPFVKDTSLEEKGSTS